MGKRTTFVAVGDHYNILCIIVFQVICQKYMVAHIVRTTALFVWTISQKERNNSIKPRKGGKTK